MADQRSQDRAGAFLDSVLGLRPPEWSAPLSEAFSAQRTEVQGWYRTAIAALLDALDAQPGPCLVCKRPLRWVKGRPAESLGIDGDGRIHARHPHRPVCRKET